MPQEIEPVSEDLDLSSPARADNELDYSDETLVVAPTGGARAEARRALELHNRDLAEAIAAIATPASSTLQSKHQRIADTQDAG